MKSARKPLAVALALALTTVVVVTGCSQEESGTRPDAPQTTEEETGTTAIGIPETDLDDWVTGSWAVSLTLVSVSPEADWARQAADQPQAQWICSINGDSMTIDAGQHVYTGSFAPVEGSADEWLYDGEATWVDEEGVLWTSYIGVTGSRTGEDTFSATQVGEISSDTEGTLYTAKWNLQATRVE